MVAEFNLDWLTILTILNGYNVTEKEKALIHNMLLDLHKKLHKRTISCEVMWDYFKDVHTKDFIQNEIQRRLEINSF